MKRNLLTTALAAFALFALAAPDAWAQQHGTPTRAGTQITATATATFTDANDNEYTATHAHTLTVAYMPGVDVAVDSDVTWDSPSNANELVYTLRNVSNDSATFSFGVTPTAGISMIGFRINDERVQPGDLSALNAVLADLAVDYQGNAGGHAHQLRVALYFNVAADLTDDGGIEVSVDAWQTGGDPSDSATEDVTTNVIFSPSYGGLTVTAERDAAAELPNGSYTARFTVTVDAAHSGGTFDLVASLGADEADFAITGIALEGGASETSHSIHATIPSGGEVVAVVTYSIDGAAVAGTVGNLSLTATHLDDTSVTDSATTEITVIAPSVSMSKRAVVAVGGAPVSANVLPGEEFWYEITVRNQAGSNSAAVLVVDVKDDLPTALDYISHVAGDLDPGYAWVIEYDEAQHVVTARLVAPEGQPALPVGVSATFWIKVRVR